MDRLQATPSYARQLAALPGRGFAAIFTMAAPQAKNGPTDIFFARIGPG